MRSVETPELGRCGLPTKLSSSIPAKPCDVMHVSSFGRCGKLDKADPAVCHNLHSVGICLG